MPAEVAVLIKAKDETGKAFDKVEKELKGFERVAEDTTNEVGDHFERLERISTATLAIATVGALRDVSEEMTEMARTGAKVESTRRTFEQFLQTVGGDAPTALEAFRQATRNTLSDMDAMAAANRFLGMGLASTVDEAAELLEASTQLATAMGKDAKTGAEEFALMLANQSIPRMDTFALSAGRGRERMAELMAANEDMTREQAFTQTVLEQSREKMAQLGDTLQGTAGDMARAQAKSENFSNSLAERLSPVLSKISMPLKTFSDMVAPAGQLAMGLGGLSGVLPGVGKAIGDMGSAAMGSVKGLTAATEATEGLATAGAVAQASLAEVVVAIAAISTATYIFQKEVVPRLEDPLSRIGMVIPTLTDVKDALHLLQLEGTDYIRSVLGYEAVHEKVRKRLRDDLQLYGKITKETREWIKTQEALAKESKQYYGVGKKEYELIVEQTEAKEDMTEATDDLAYSIKRAMWALEDKAGTLDGLSEAERSYVEDTLEWHEKRDRDMAEIDRRWEERERERIAVGRQMAAEWYEAQGSLYTELGTEHLSLRQRMEAEEEQHTEEMNRLSQERTKEAQAAMDAEIARHNAVMAALGEERTELLATSAVQMLANRRYEDGTTALSRLFGENIETGKDLFDIMTSGSQQLAKRDLVKLVAAMQMVAKQESKNRLIAESNQELWEDALKEGKKLYGEQLAAAAKIEPAYRDMYETVGDVIDTIMDAESEYERWARNAVRNIEDVDTEMYGLDHTAISHHGTVAMIGSAYEITAQRAASAIRSIPAWPQPPTWTAPYVPTPPTPIAPLPIWYPGYQSGGTVPGPIGRPQMAMVHGGETITPPGRGGGITFDFRGAQFYGITQDFVEDLFRENETLLKLQGVRAGARA